MSTLCLVPTRLRASRAARRLCDAEGGLLFGPRVVTPEELVAGLLASAGDRRPVLSPLAERLLAVEAGRDALVDAALVEMHRDHVGHGVVLEPVLAICEALVAAPERHAELAPELARAGRILRAHFEAHLASEEGTIFPLISRTVPQEERRRMIDELRGRRDGAAPGYSSR